MPSNIKISVVIPTRERAETLKYTIQTALNQKLQDYEVIVSDNFSQDGTKEVVNSFKDSRLKYFKTLKRLSMTENFDFGVSNAKGEYIIVIGDDDGVMPNAIDKLDKLIDSNKSLLYTWPRHIYNWPFKHAQAKFVRFAKLNETRKINLREAMSGMLNNGVLLNSEMPNSYHSATHRSVFKEIKKATGVYYQTTVPDQFMLFTFPVFCEYALNLGEPLTVDGHSPKSNSGSLLHSKKNKNDNEEREVDRFIKEQSTYKLHMSIPTGLPKAPSMMIDTFLVVRDLFSNFYSTYTVNYSGMWAYSWQILHSPNMLEPIRRKEEFKEAEKFSATKYFIFSILFSTYLKTFGKVRPKSKVEKKLQSIFQINSPKNIVEFVTFVEVNQHHLNQTLKSYD